MTRVVSTMNLPQKRELLQQLITISDRAGAEVLALYQQSIAVEHKDDGSPVTLADQASEKIILSGLRQAAPEIPIVSEETSDSHQIRAKQFFLVDPLDGTKEFVRKDAQGGFTVNIALIEQVGDKLLPVLGVVFAPALQRMFSGIVGDGAIERDQQRSKSISIRQVLPDGIIAVASLSHKDPATVDWLKKNNITQTRSIGSSLKFCLIACGEADVYPRFAPTMEWDTAAGEAVLRAAGGSVSMTDGTPFYYGKKDYRNEGFIAYGNCLES